MLKTLKLSGERGTSWLSGPVKQARIRLMGVYLVLMALVLVVTGASIRLVFESRLDRRFVPPPSIIAHFENGQLAVIRPTRDDLRQDLLDTLLVVNLGAFFSSAVLAYILAGLTLRPVQTAADRERRFISHASHELRTPLAILQAEMETAAMDAPPEEKAHIASYLEEVDRLRKLTNTLLGQRSADQSPENLPLADFLQKELARVTDLAQDHQVSLSLREISPTLQLTTVPIELSIVLQNVLQNAIRYNKPEGQVEVSVEAQSKKCVITVKDNGLGIPAADLAHVTERFYRVQRQQASGTGLGLALSKEIVVDLGGELLITSTEGEGTEVKIVLPR